MVESRCNIGCSNGGYADETVMVSHSHGVYILAMIWPFADWDQKSCRDKIAVESII
jgi:hypothetical protein